MPDPFQVQCSYRRCGALTEPQPDAEALAKWLSANGWKLKEDKYMCPWCVLATRPSQRSWEQGYR